MGQERLTYDAIHRTDETARQITVMTFVGFAAGLVSLYLFLSTGMAAPLVLSVLLGGLGLAGAAVASRLGRQATAERRRLIRSASGASRSELLAAYDRSFDAGCFFCKAPSSAQSAKGHHCTSCNLWLCPDCFLAAGDPGEYPRCPRCETYTFDNYPDELSGL